MVSGGITI